MGQEDSDQLKMIPETFAGVLESPHDLCFRLWNPMEHSTA